MVVKQENTPNHQTSDTQADQNVAIQRKLAGFTGWLVVVGFIQAVILACTIWAILNQTSVNRAMQRAWVMVDIAPDPKGSADGKVHVFLGDGTEGKSTGVFSVLLAMRNEGKSPAWVDEIRAKFEIVKTLHPIPRYDDATFVDFEPDVLGIGQSVPHTKKISFSPIAQGHTELGKMPTIYGVVRYRDIFRKMRESRFAYQVSPSRDLTRVVNQEYNKNT